MTRLPNTLRFSALDAPTCTDICGILVSPLIRHRRIRLSPQQSGSYASQFCTAAVRSGAVTGDDSDRGWDGYLSGYKTSRPYRGADPQAFSFGRRSLKLYWPLINLLEPAKFRHLRGTRCRFL